MNIEQTHELLKKIDACYNGTLLVKVKDRETLFVIINEWSKKLSRYDEGTIDHAYDCIEDNFKGEFAPNVAQFSDLCRLKEVEINSRNNILITHEKDEKIYDKKLQHDNMKKIRSIIRNAINLKGTQDARMQEMFAFNT